MHTLLWYYHLHFIQMEAHALLGYTDLATRENKDRVKKLAHSPVLPVDKDETV